MMKKLAISMAVAAAMGMTAADAAVVSEYSVGFLVPNVIHNGSADTTGVGIISRYKGTVYWTFFDVDSNHITDGSFPVTANDLGEENSDQSGFVWANQSGVGLEGERGYLVFVADVAKENSDGTCTVGQEDGVITKCDADLQPIAGSAAQFFLNQNDASFTPVIPLANVDLSTFPITPTNLGPADVDYLVAGANCVASGWTVSGSIGTLKESIPGPYHDDIDMRYFIEDRQGGKAVTNIVVWSAQDVSGTWTVNMFDKNQNRKSVNFTLPNKELNFINVEDIKGRPADFKDGFIRWDVPCGKLVADTDLNDDGTISASEKAGEPAPWNGVISYSEIHDPEIKAVQTIINPFGANVTP